jgi:hypothetical protein
MSSIYKTFTNNDKVSTRTLLHEAIPLTGTIVSGTYGTNNIKTYAHGMFQSVYDYPFLSSSANHIFDISVGTAEASSLTVTTAAQNTKKDNIYNQMAQVLMGYDASGATLSFDEDGDISGGGTKLDEVFFLNFSRLLVKDEIQKGTFELVLDVTTGHTASAQPFTDRIKVSDISGSSGFFVNSPAGEYGILFANTDASVSGNPLVVGEASVGIETGLPPCGLVFYQAGVVVLSGSVFNVSTNATTATDGLFTSVHVSSGTGVEMVASAGSSGFDFITASTNDVIADAVRHRIQNVQFNNTIELNSTVYFCRANHNEFNYSANKTYLTGSQIRVKNQASDMPVSYITSIGLYSADGTLLGVSKLSEPIKKTPNEEYIFRVRVDY